MIVLLKKPYTEIYTSLLDRVIEHLETLVISILLAIDTVDETEFSRLLKHKVMKYIQYYRGWDIFRFVKYSLANLFFHIGHIEHE